MIVQNTRVRDYIRQMVIQRPQNQEGSRARTNLQRNGEQLAGPLMKRVFVFAFIFDFDFFQLINVCLFPLGSMYDMI